MFNSNKKGEEKDDKIFSYNSNVRDSTAFKVLGVEFVIIVIIIVVALFLLNYFLIFPLGILNPKLFGWLPTRSLSVQKAYKDINAVMVDKSKVRLKPEIVINSIIQNYKLELGDPQKLADFLNSISFWGFEPTILGKRQIGIKKLNIVLTNQVQPNNQFTAKKIGVYMSANIESSNGQVKIIGYLSDYILSQDGKKRGQFFDQLIVSTIYRFINTSKGIDLASQNSNLNLIYKEMSDKDISFFTIILK